MFILRCRFEECVLNNFIVFCIKWYVKLIGDNGMGLLESSCYWFVDGFV